MPVITDSQKQYNNIGNRHRQDHAIPSDNALNANQNEDSADRQDLPTDVVMVPGLGALPAVPPKYNPANDNVPQDGPVSGGFVPVTLTGGQYIGLTRADFPAVHPAYQQRFGDYMQTYIGWQYWPIDPQPEDVFIQDIAHSLSLQCRYAGHCISFYSVAEHSVHIARWLHERHGPLVALYGLLHDAPEAYCVDVPRPLKPFLSNYKDIEARNWEAIAKRFGLSAQLPEEVHEADNRIIADELTNMIPMEWHSKWKDPLGVKIGCWSPQEAEDWFILEFHELTALFGRPA